MLFKEIVDARTHARTDDGRRTLKDHKSSLEHFVLRCSGELKTVNDSQIIIIIKIMIIENRFKQLFVNMQKWPPLMPLSHYDHEYQESSRIDKFQDS